MKTAHELLKEKGIEPTDFISSSGYEATAQTLQELLDVIRDVGTNPHMSLGDHVYEVRDKEGDGWEGPAVVAWGDVCRRIEELTK